MEKSVPNAFRFCTFYNKRTHRCRIDGSSWCAFPRSTWCDLSAGEAARKHKMPAVIIEIKRALMQNA